MHINKSGATAEAVPYGNFDLEIEIIDIDF